MTISSLSSVKSWLFAVRQVVSLYDFPPLTAVSFPSACLFIKSSAAQLPAAIMTLITIQLDPVLFKGVRRRNDAIAFLRKLS